jgi:hypothetical protein
LDTAVGYTSGRPRHRDTRRAPVFPGRCGRRATGPAFTIAGAEAAKCRGLGSSALA